MLVIEAFFNHIIITLIFLLSIFFLYSSYRAIRVIIKKPFRKIRLSEDMVTNLEEVVFTNMIRGKTFLIIYLATTLSMTALSLIEINYVQIAYTIIMMIMIVSSMFLRFVPLVMILNGVAVLRLISLLEHGDISISDLGEKEYKLLIIPVNVSSRSTKSTSSRNRGGGGRSGGAGAGGKWK